MDAKSIARSIVGAEPEVEEASADPLDIMAEDVLAAVKSGDAAMLKGALKSFFIACDSGSDEEM